MTTFSLVGARLFTGETWLHDHAIVIENDRVVGLPRHADRPGGASIDLGGRMLVPGLIDLQVNGGGGVLFNADPTRDGLERLVTAHRAHGTTGLLATAITDTPSVLDAAAEAVDAALAYGCPGLLGLHLEGPFLNPLRKGAHDANLIRQPTLEDATALTLPARGAALVTLAPEMVPEGFVGRLAATGAVISAGHTNADPDTLRLAMAEGLTGITHLFNAMPPLAGRAPGPVGAALTEPGLACGLIVDGYHVDPVNCRLALAAKSPGEIFLVSDAMPTVGTQMDRFDLQGREIQVREGRCTLADGTLAGSALDMATAVSNTVRLLGVGLDEALRMASLYPARLMNLDAGRIALGCSADLTILDDDLVVHGTWIAGRAFGRGGIAV